jgi:hypothetical protein
LNLELRVRRTLRRRKRQGRASNLRETIPTQGVCTMTKRNRFNHKRHNKPRAAAPRATEQREAPLPFERKPPVVYGKPFVLLEDVNKNTFEYKSGAWIPHAMTIAECRQTCKVKELPQKLKQMTRYEVRAPLLESA